MADGTGATRTLAEFAATLTLDDIPAEVRHQAQRIVVDTLSCVLAAYEYPPAAILERVVGASGGPAEATILPGGTRTGAAQAAYVNAELANLLDLDDNLLNHTHFANTAVAAPLAMAERLGAGGADLVRAVVVAYEVSARLTLSLTAVALVQGSWPDVELVFNEVFGQGSAIFGATAGCGALLGLSTGHMRHAFGLAGYAAPVPSLSKYASVSVDAPNMNKYAAYGSIASASVLSALLAAEGFSGDDTVLDGPRGFWRMAGSMDSHWDVLTGGLGETWWSLETSFKAYPTCTWNRTPLEAMLALVQEHDLQPAEVEAVDVALSPTVARPPFDAHPTTALHTFNSCPYALAMAVLRVPGPEWQRQATIDRADVREQMAKVTLRPDPAAQEVFREQIATGVQRVRRSPATVTVSARGTTFSAFAEFAKGDPFTAASRMSDDDLRGKLRDYGAPVLGAGRIEAAADLLFALEQVDDVRAVTRALAR